MTAFQYHDRVTVIDGQPPGDIMRRCLFRNTDCTGLSGPVVAIEHAPGGQMDVFGILLEVGEPEAKLYYFDACDLVPTESVESKLCEWCDHVIEGHHPTAEYDGDEMHLHCAARAMDEEIGE